MDIGHFFIDLISLTILEIALGIDNVIFVSIVIGNLPESQHPKARKVWIFGSFIVKALMLVGLDFTIKSIGVLFHYNETNVTLKELFLIIGGTFLFYKSIVEIHDKLEAVDEENIIKEKNVDFWKIMSQVLLLDSVFSMDIIVTALGMVSNVWVMCGAIAISMLIMFYFASPIAKLVEEHPTTKILALSFLMLIGMTLVIEGLGIHIPKGYIYFAMFFSVVVEFFNVKYQTKKKRKYLKINFPDVSKGILKPISEHDDPMDKNF